MFLIPGVPSNVYYSVFVLQWCFILKNFLLCNSFFNNFGRVSVKLTIVVFIWDYFIS